MNYIFIIFILISCLCIILNNYKNIYKNKKTAILIFGQLRSYKKCYKSLFDNIINQNYDHNFDIYLITWKKEYNEELLKYYKPYDILLLDYNDFLKDLEGIDKLKIGLDYKNSNIKDKNTYFVQLWQWYKSYQFIKHKKYDYIIKTRFDIKINKPIKIDNNNYFIDFSERNKTYKIKKTIDDLFFILKDHDILNIWINQNKLDFIDKKYLINNGLYNSRNKIELILEILLTIYVRDYKKYNYKLLDDKTIRLIR